MKYDTKAAERRRKRVSEDKALRRLLRDIELHDADRSFTDADSEIASGMFDDPLNWFDYNMKINKQEMTERFGKTFK